jgi:hypothetical protein
MPELKRFLNLLTNIRFLQTLGKNSSLTNTNKPNIIESGPSSSIPILIPIFKADNITSDLLPILSSPEDSQVDEYTSFIWLLILDLLIFCFLSFKAHQATIKIEENLSKNSEHETDTDTGAEDSNINNTNKLKFMKGLTYANGSKYNK